MNWKINILFILISFSACTESDQVESAHWSSKYLVEIEELKTLMQDTAYKIVDFRKVKEYQEGHIEGALNIWRTDIEDSSFNYSGMMASTSQIEDLFSTLGVKTTDTIVIYDDNGLCDASRLWWVLQNYDYEAVKLLHGGFRAWQKSEGLVSQNQPVIHKSKFKLTESPSMKFMASKTQVLEAIDSETIILDTRTRDEFTGKRQKSGAAKGGRIPASLHLDWAEAIDYSGDMKIKPLTDLEEVFAKATTSKEDSIIVYCHSGVRSAHTSFVMNQLLGFKNVKNYDGSWVEWSHNERLPIQKDSITTLN